MWAVFDQAVGCLGPTLSVVLVIFRVHLSVTLCIVALGVG